MTSYKSCAVPLCKNTTTKYPDKLFIHVPKFPKRRKQWLKLARRHLDYISDKSTIFFCEDHFNLPNDMENYIKYSLMGSVGKIRMKPDCLPSKFQCQSDRIKDTAPPQPRSALSKRLYMDVKQEILTEEIEMPATSRITSNCDFLSATEKNDCSNFQDQATQVYPEAANKSIQRLDNVEANVGAVDEPGTSSQSERETVNFWLQRNEATGGDLVARRRQNFKRITTAEQDADMVAAFYCPPYLSKEGIAKQFNVSSKTVTRRLQAADVTNMIKSKDSCHVTKISIFCPRCNTEVPHTGGGIQEDKIKILVSRVFHHFEQEYEELKTLYEDLDLTPFAMFHHRTAMATGVSEATLMQILQEEERRNEEREREPPQTEPARKRRRQMDSSSKEVSWDHNDDNTEQPNYSDEIETLVVKTEPPEFSYEEPEIMLPLEVQLEPSVGEIDTAQLKMDPIAVEVKTELRDDELATVQLQMDPISVEVKTELRDDELATAQLKMDPIAVEVKTELRDDELATTTETPARNKPATPKCYGRKISRKSDHTPIQSCLPGGKEIKKTRKRKNT